MVIKVLALATATLTCLTPVNLRPQQPSSNATGPSRVLIDEAHNNNHTSIGGYAALARLLRQHGFVVGPLRTRITPESLAQAT